ncbi:hypothetical protein AAFF_G00115120 [Aldrovandia affinis]|uniref:Ig-like domain-containing protein n=1 Tax=Aldrovandia affinis TaxID=143900 RepID=A0AAD7VXF1_9TELE|nr:hypothetical protein AAFF_G00115120 [Aldrovandia affinis]
MVGVSFQDEIRSTSNAVRALAGSNVTLSCNYTGTAWSIQWYRQYPGSKPEVLVLVVRGQKRADNGRFTAQLYENNNLVHLELSSAEVSDSALYYCAL